MSALVSAVLKKMDRNTELRATSGTMNIHQKRSPLGCRKCREIHCHIRQLNLTFFDLSFPLKNEVNRLNSVQKATDLKQKSKWK